MDSLSILLTATCYKGTILSYFLSWIYKNTSNNTIWPIYLARFGTFLHFVQTATKNCTKNARKSSQSVKQNFKDPLENPRIKDYKNVWFLF